MCPMFHLRVLRNTSPQPTRTNLQQHAPTYPNPPQHVTQIHTHNTPPQHSSPHPLLYTRCSPRTFSHIPYLPPRHHILPIHTLHTSSPHAHSHLSTNPEQHTSTCPSLPTMRTHMVHTHTNTHTHNSTPFQPVLKYYIPHTC